MRDLIKILILKMFGENSLIKISRKKNELKMWSIFLKSLITIKKDFYIYSIETWQFGTDMDKRRDIYISQIQKDEKIKFILLNYESEKMIRFLNLYMKIRNLEENTYSKIIKQRVSNQIIKFETIYKKCLWDCLMREEFFYKNKNLLPYERENYANIYNKLEKRIPKFKTKKIIKLILNSNIKKFFFSGQGLMEWAWSALVQKYDKPAYFMESTFGLMCFKKNKINHIDIRLSNFIKNLSKNVNDYEINQSKQNLNQRVNGNYQSKHLFYMSREDIVERKKYFFKKIYDNSIFLFLHAFTDAPNSRLNNDSNFIDYYDWTLFILDYCTENKIPLYIKPHPNRYDFLSEQIFIKSLKNAISIKSKKNDSYVEFIEGNFNQIDLKLFKNVVAVSARGSVSIECGYLGIPIINCFPEYHNFGFSVNLSNFKNFKEALEFCKNSYNPINARDDAINYEISREKMINKSLFELTNISRITKSKHKIDGKVLDLVSEI